MTNSHSSLDARVAQAEVSERLKRLMHLPRTSRAIADWLYNEDAQTQRENGILSPETFQRSVATNTMQSYTDLSVPLTPPNSKSKITEYSENFIYTLYVPVKELDDVSVGYSFHTGIPRRGFSILDVDIFPKLKTNRARYAYKRDARLMLIFMRVSAKTDMILYVHWTNESQRQIQYFMIPHKQYSYDDPPSVVISSTCSEADCLCRSSPPRKPRDFRTSNTPMFDINREDDVLPSGPSDYVDGVWREDNISSLPQCMFQDLYSGSETLENRPYRESSCWLREQQVRSLSRSHTNGLIQFEKRSVGRIHGRDGGDLPVALMDGDFFSAYVVRDSFNGSGGVAQRHAFEVRTRATAADPARLKLLRQAAAQLYYSVVLWASTDQRLVAAQEHLAAELLCDVKGKEREE